MDAVVAAGEQPQTLRGLVEKLGLGQDPAPDGYNGIRGENIGTAELLVLAHKVERGVGFARASRLAQARGSSPRFGVSSTSVGRSASGSMAGLIDEREPAGRAGREHELRSSNHFLRSI